MVWVVFALIAIAAISALHVRAKQQRLRDLVAETCRFFNEINARRAFPMVPAPSFNLRTGEFAVICCNATLHQLRRHGYSTGGSMRVAKGFYVSQRHYHSYQSLDAVAKGTACVTNMRVLFAGGAKTATVDYKDVVSVESAGSCVHLHSTKRQKPIIVEFPNSLLVSLLVQLFSSIGLQGNSFPDHLRITAEPGSESGAVNLRWGSGMAGG